jgi:hypothetical protein
LSQQGISGFGTRPSDIADRELCCQQYDGGSVQCFSQAGWIITPP